MARAWRLRHKLVFGLALVVGSVALLLGATVFGLSAYFDTGRVTQRKIGELEMVQLLRAHADSMAAPLATEATETPLNAEWRQIDAAARQMHHSLTGYAETVRQSDISGRAVHENKLLQSIATATDDLTQAVQAAAMSSGRTGGRLLDDPAPAAAYKLLRQHINCQHDLLVQDVKDTHARGEVNHKKSLVVAGVATTIALVLVLTLLHYFRVWVFGPIRELQAGVQRVHRGDFDHPIPLSARDELGELAAEFNRMSTRMQDTQKSLVGQVNARTRQLVRSERLVSVGFLAAGVAHEINNPLASIAFCAEALESRLQEGSTGDAAVVTKYLRMMQDEAQRCKEITQKLLDFSRSGGKREPADLAATVAQVLDVARTLPNAKQKTMTFTANEPVVLPMSVPDIKGVVLNLAVNALDSMDENGHLAVKLSVQDGQAELTFTDTGCGMTPETLKTIFEPFFTQSRTGKGTGLGLSISHQVVDQHGGTITATSAGPGRGSTFTVRLPLRPAADTGLDSPPASVLFRSHRTAA